MAIRPSPGLLAAPPGVPIRPFNQPIRPMGPPDVRTPTVMPTRSGQRFLRGMGGRGSRNRY